MSAGQRHQFCTFLLDSLLFGVEVGLVQEVFRRHEVTYVPLAPDTIRGLVNLRGQVVIVVDLRRRLGFGERPPGQSPESVVVKTREGLVCFQVDEVGEIVEAPLESFEPPPDTLQGNARELLVGVYKLRDQLLLELDAEQAAC